MNRRERRRAQRAAKRGAALGIVAASPEIQERFQHAVAMFQAGNVAAEGMLREIEGDAPGIPEVSHLLGVILLQAGRAGDALEPLLYATRATGGDAEVMALSAVAQYQLGNLKEATAAFREAIARDPESTDAHFNFGNVLRDAGNIPEAAHHFREAVRIAPDFADAHYNLAVVDLRLHNFDAALKGFEKTLALNPDQPDAYAEMSRALNMAFRYEEGEQAARTALRQLPNSLQAINNLGQSLQLQGRLSEAEEVVRRGLQLDPNASGLWANYGNILQDDDKFDEAIEAYRKSIEIDPEFAVSHCNLGILLLLHNQFEEGWREFDWRWRLEYREPPRPFPQPRWLGEGISEKTILAWADEGVGDDILFASLFPDLVARSGRIVVECDPRLTGLFGRVFPEIEFVAKTTRPKQELLGVGIDVQTPFTELARWLRPDLAAAVGPDEAYLEADRDLTDACRDRYRSRGDGLIVGIAWASGNVLRAERNAPLPHWDPILTLPGLQFVSLQYGDRSAELAEIRDRLGVDIFVDPHVDQMKSMEEFAAQVSAVDLVVSITNTTVHMAGALGKPVWTMLPFMPDWRYQLDRPDTPWYPRMRLFRQTKSREWGEVMDRVAAQVVDFRDSQ